MAGIVEVDKLLKARVVLSSVFIVAELVAVVIVATRDQVFGAILVGAVLGTFGLFLNRHEAEKYVVHRRPATQLGPRVSVERAVLPESVAVGVLVAAGALIIGALNGGFAGLIYPMALLPAELGASYMQLRGWRRLMAAHENQQAWIATRPVWRLRSRWTGRADGVFVLDEETVTTTSLPSTQ